MQGHTEVKGRSIREAGDLREDGASEETINKSQVGSKELREEGRRNQQTDEERVGYCLNTYLVTRTDFGSLMKT